MCSLININLFSSSVFLVNGYSCSSKFGRKKDYEINLPAICCALTAVLRLYQHFFHPQAATSQYPNDVEHPKATLPHRKVPSEETGFLLHISCKSFKEKKRQKVSQKLFSRCFPALWQSIKHKEGNFLIAAPSNTAFFCLILR